MSAAIKINLDLLLVQRKKSLTELSDEVGITLANLSILKRGKARAIRFSTLVAICEALECEPGDLLGLDRGVAEEQSDDP
jgi:putative transcriptional regulator